MRYLRDELKWHFRIRVKSNTWIDRPGKGWKQLHQDHLAVGKVVLLQGVKLTKTHTFGALNLVLGRDPIGRQVWFVATDEPASLQTFHEYGLRFQIAEELLDEKSNGFQLERSEMRSAIALSPLCFVLAVAKKAADGSGITSGCDRLSALGRWSLARRQQLSENRLELGQRLFASRMAIISLLELARTS